MPEIVPFRGILYRPSQKDPAGADISDRLAPPYDVINEAERQALSQRSPYNAVHLILPQPPASTSGPGADPDARYALAAQTLAGWVAEGAMARDGRPALYRYHQIFSPPGEPGAAPIRRRGFIARIRLHRFSEGVILPHERTLAGPKADRLKLKRATRTHLSQVFGLYDDPSRRADAAFAALEAQPPELTGVTADGVRHELWRLTDPEQIAVVQGVLAHRPVYIADGHHRYETMLALREELRREPGYRGPDSAVEFGSIFLCNVEDPGLIVFPTHRVLHSLPGFDLVALLNKLSASFLLDERPVAPGGGAEVKATLAQKGAAAPSYLLLSGGRSIYLTLRPDADLSAVSGPEVARRLDVTVLHALVIERALGIDRAAQEAQTNLRYLKDTEQALRAAAEPGVQAVFVMNPTKVREVMAVAEAGEVMPQKSTYFYPKIASGLVLNPLDPAEPIDTVESIRDALARTGALPVDRPVDRAGENRG